MPGLVDLLLPRRCVGCGETGETLCAACTASLRRIRPPLCARCGAPTAWPVPRCHECAGRRLGFASARSAYVYVGAARSFVHVWKERGLRHLAAWAAELVCGVVERPTADLIVAVPPDADRLLRRGHHPPGRLALELGRRWEIETGTPLARTRHTARQVALARDDRRRNVRGLFVGRVRERRSSRAP
jgi:predicted amidophosphoribosyltransferase